MAWVSSEWKLDRGWLAARRWSQVKGNKMPKSRLRPTLDQLESDIIETLLAGHHEWRPDLPYPESHSDMQGAVRGLLRMFKVERRPLPEPLEYHCEECHNSGYIRTKLGDYFEEKKCKCKEKKS
jgi:hypothetical protein